MTAAEAGELTLLREWMRIPAGWMQNEAGALWRSRPKPASWQSEQGAAKTIALWDILGCDPFPAPEGKPVRFEAGIAAPEVVGEAPEPKRKRAEEPVPIEPFRAAEKQRRREAAKALESEPEMDAAWWDSVAGSDPPGR